MISLTRIHKTGIHASRENVQLYSSGQRKTECCWLRGIVAEVEIEQRVKTEALSRVEAAEGIDAA